LFVGFSFTLPLRFQHRPALVAYLTCGDPDLATTLDIALAAIDAGAEIIELGVPFSDPVADGPVIQRASERALRHGTSLLQVLELARQIRKKSQAGLIIFTYLNPVLRMGIKNFSAAAQDACVDGALITDLPVEESGEYLAEMQKRNLATVFLAAPTSTDARLKQIAVASSGFVYAVSRTGVTGARQQMPEDAPKLVGRLRRYTDLPVAVGFGISTSEQIRAVGKFADAAVVGSAIVEIIERNPGKEAESVAQFVGQLSVVGRQSSALQR
jgi:tryptophan synthase alpha chain